jgi:hypothetical protein
MSPKVSKHNHFAAVAPYDYFLSLFEEDDLLQWPLNKLSKQQAKPAGFFFKSAGCYFLLSNISNPYSREGQP